MQGVKVLENRDVMCRAEILSTAGAAVLGAGLGLLLGRWLAPLTLPLFGVGITTHAWGMYERHRLVSRTGVMRARWEEPVYWICWIAPASILIYAFLFS